MDDFGLEVLYDAGALLAAGFRIDPDKVIKLPGLPEPETVDFTITFESKSFKVKLGPLTHVMKLELKPGPPVAVLMKVNITVPDLKLSESSLDFADVVVGRSRTVSAAGLELSKSNP